MNRSFCFVVAGGGDEEEEKVVAAFRCECVKRRGRAVRNFGSSS